MICVRPTRLVPLVLTVIGAVTIVGCGATATDSADEQVTASSATSTDGGGAAENGAATSTDAPATTEVPAPTTTEQPTTTVPATTLSPATPPPTSEAVDRPADVTPDDVANMLLPNDTCHGWNQLPEYRLTNGEYYDGAQFKMTLESAVYEDFNGDGATDAFFEVHCLAGANDWTGSAIVKIAGQDPYVIPDQTLMALTALTPGSEVRAVYEVSYANGVADVAWYALLPSDEYRNPWLIVDTYGTITPEGFRPDYERFRADGQVYPEYPATPDEHFEWPNLYEVPQLGAEAVRGSGCGIDTPIGDTLPDGWWYGYPSAMTAGGFEFDLVCVYYGAGAHTKIAECVAGGDSMCLAAFGEEFFPENNNYNTRPVAMAPGFVAANPDIDGDSCEALPQYRTDLSIVHIVDGQAAYMRFTCVTGG